MAYTIRKIKSQVGVVYRAIIKDRLRKPVTSKTFNRKTDAKVRADQIDSGRDPIAAYGNKVAKMTFSKLADEYMSQWHGKDQVRNSKERSIG